MTSTQITLHDTPSSPELARRLQDKCERLGRIHPDARYCRVEIHGPLAGEAHPAYGVTLRVSLPGGEVAPGPERHPMLSVALNRAFAAAAERLAQLAPAPADRASRRKAAHATARPA